MEIAYLAIRWQSWQTWFKTEKLTNIPPPSRGGLIVAEIHGSCALFDFPILFVSPLARFQNCLRFASSADPLCGLRVGGTGG